MDKNFFALRTKNTPKDSMMYIVPARAMQNTERVLTEYANIDPSNEGLVYWGGTRQGNVMTVLIVVAPETESNFGRVSTSNRANFDVVRTLNRNNLVQIAQVHSHPSDWVDHSEGDDEWAAFKIEGLISIVVPEYCKNGMLPLMVCGVHRYTQGNFIRLSDTYIEKHFKIVKDVNCDFEDLRK